MSKVKRPQTVKVGFLTFAIVYDKKSVDKMSKKKQESDGTSIAAYTSALDATIVLDPTTNLSVLKQTLLHEIVHTCYRVWGVDPDVFARNLIHAGDKASPVDIEEYMTEFISAGLLTVFLDNPKLIAWLLDKN